jgi:hypothetical protein
MIFMKEEIVEIYRYVYNLAMRYGLDFSTLCLFDAVFRMHLASEITRILDKFTLSTAQGSGLPDPVLAILNKLSAVSLLCLRLVMKHNEL